MSNNIAKIIATFFYTGYAPFASGSVASLWGAGAALLCSGNLNTYVIIFGIVTLGGFVASGTIEKSLNDKDPSCVVVDEVSGAMIAFFMLPVTPSVLITAYFLFRAFDMFKIYPADKFENIPGGVGIMIDDIVAGLYTNIVMRVALLLQGSLFLGLR